MNDEIRFIDLYSGVGGFRRGLEKANEERRILRRQDMHGHRTDADERIRIRHITQESPRDSEIRLERANSGLGAEFTGGEGWHQVKEGHRADFGGKDGNGREEHTDGYYRCVWSCDNNKHANQIYTKQFGEEGHYSGDVRGVDQGEIPDFDLLCAGFPCQSFSVAGKRKGFEDTRGTLFFEICRIAEAKRPSLLLLENVKGLLSHERGETFYTILQSLEDLGYWVEWQVLNSRYFGVPQNRERVFIIGHLAGSKRGAREIFPIGKDDRVSETKRDETLPTLTGTDWKGPSKQRASIVVGVETAFRKSNMKQGRFTEESVHALDGGASKAVILDKVGNIAKSGHDSIWGRVYNPQGIASTLNAEGGGVGAKTGLYAISFTNPHNPEEERKINLSDTSRAVKPPYGNQQPLILADRTRSYAGLGRNLESPKEITNALSGIQKDNILMENFRIRRLTPVECERLQGFQDGWTAQGLCKKGDIVWTGKYRTRVEIDEDGSEVTRYHPIMTKAKADGVYPICDTNRYKCLGNAVTVPVITFLGKRIREAEK